MFSVIIPCFHAPAYLDLCLRSALEGQTMANQYVVVIDGCEAEYAVVLERYAKWIFPLVLPVNEGLCMALNKGVLLAESSRLLLINEDNVLPPGWDQRLLQEFREDLVLTINQIEPEGKSIFDHFL
ncbi:MAG: glycosyltransferase family 2 protein, partial [Candidatus Sericytochromatia bacterium]